MEIKIKSKRDGFRRCGIPHLAEWVTHPDGTFTEAEISVLKAEPMLDVRAIPKKSKKKGGKK